MRSSEWFHSQFRTPNSAFRVILIKGMPRFSYRAKDHTLHVVEGTIEAESESSAISHLGREGIYPISIAPLDIPATDARLPSRRRRISTQTLASTTHQLADLASPHTGRDHYALSPNLPLIGLNSSDRSVG